MFFTIQWMLTLSWSAWDLFGFCLWVYVGEKQLDDLLWFSYSLPCGGRKVVSHGRQFPSPRSPCVSKTHSPVSHQWLMFTICLRLESFCTDGCNPHGYKRRNTETGFMFQNSQGMTDLSIVMGSRLDHAKATVKCYESVDMTISQFCRAAVKWHAHTSIFKYTDTLM